MKRLLCIWLPNWPIQSHRLQRQAQTENAPNSNSLPTESITVLWSENARRVRMVVACCDRASMMGVRIGMPLLQANQLLSHSADSADSAKESTNVLPHDRHLDDRTLERLAEQVQASICPEVAIETLAEKPWAGCPRHQAESLVCDISGVEHLFDGGQGIVAAITKNLAEANSIPLHARLAIAPNAAAAWALAHFGKQAVETATEDNLVSVIQELPVESLRLEISVVNTLHRLGIERVDQLLRLPRSGLATRLGKPLVNRISQMLGQFDEPMTVHHPLPILSCSTELEYPTQDRDILLDRIEQLIDQIHNGLSLRHHGALRLRCRLSLVESTPITMTIGLFAPSQEKKHLFSLIHTRLETQSTRHDVEKITIDVPLTAPLRHSQNELFEAGELSEASSIHTFGGSSISRLVDSLSSRLGRDTVLSVKATKDSLPENSYKLAPMSEDQKSKKRKTRRSISAESGPNTNNHLPAHTDAMRRPLTVLSQPLVLEAMETRSLHPGNVPAAFRLRGRTYRIVRRWGPERIETQWWNGPSIRRDYYRVETDDGCWWWIYRDFSDNHTSPTQKRVSPGKSRWMLHGQFT